MSVTMRTRRPRRGIFLIHMLMTIGLLAGFVIVAERVFRLSVLTVSKTAAGQEEALRLERAMEVLRADVWRAAKVEPAENGSSVRVTDAAGKTVEWQTDGQSGDLVRIEGGEERRWPELGLVFRSAEGGVLSVTTKAGEVAVLRRAGGAR
jgi:type II secretory pathway component PulJ